MTGLPSTTPQPSSSAASHPGRPSRIVAVCFGPRTGSNLLCAEMSKTGCLGTPKEYFNYDGQMFGMVAQSGASSLEAYVSHLLLRQSTSNGIFATKLLPGHWLMLLNSRSGHLLRNAHCLITVRFDTIAQAVSHAIASKTGLWFGAIGQDPGQTAYDYHSVLNALRYLEKINRFWANLAKDHAKNVFVAAYEDIAQNAQQVASNAARHFDIELTPSTARTEFGAPIKQATERNLEWAERFKSDLARNGDGLAPPVFGRR